ncbi:MAG: hypothetical protein COA94_02350 [Rickettsiales bacterium]|nr:MAG: hypothetical protein COA94_02350 [Rickettsiales bacterium]
MESVIPLTAFSDKLSLCFDAGVYLNLDNMTLSKISLKYTNEVYKVTSNRSSTFLKYIALIKDNRCVFDLIKSNNPNISNIFGFLWNDEKKVNKVVMDRKSIWTKYCGRSMDGKCFCCKMGISYWDWNESCLIPVSCGGSTTEENIRITCFRCHKASSTYVHLAEYMLHMKYDIPKSVPSEVINLYKSIVSICESGEHKIDHLVKDKRISLIESAEFKTLLWDLNLDTRFITYNTLCEIFNRFRSD